MDREEKSERSRRKVLDAGLQLFSKQGFRATSVREIANAAAVSIGNVYHHFPDKQAIFTELLNEYAELSSTGRFPFVRALEQGHFPGNIEHLGFAARESVRQYRSHIAIVYVDMIEFEGTHMRDFYSGMAMRFRKFLDATEDTHGHSRKLRDGVDAASALMMIWRMYFNYFMIEILFGVPEPFAKDTATVVAEIADVLRKGICR